MHEPPTFYHILGVAEDIDQAGLDDVLTAQLAANADDSEKIQLLRLCRQTLGNAPTRAAYDRKLRLLRARRRCENTAQPPVASGTGPRWLVAFAALALCLGVGKFGIPESRPPLAHIPVVTTTVKTLPQGIAPATAAFLADAPPPQPTAALPASTASQSAEAVFPAPLTTLQATRPAKKSGFDPAYLAWSVFMIRQSRSSGSGVMIAADKILTNCHVLAGAALNGMVVVHSMTRKVTPVEKYARLDGEDACLVFAPGAGGAPIEWGSSASLRPSDTVHAFGHPGGGSDIAWSEGKLLARAEKNGEEFLFSDTYCRPGSSGGPLLDDEGRLIGIVTAGQRYADQNGEVPRYGACISLGESVARALLTRPLFPIALAPAQYLPNR